MKEWPYKYEDGRYNEYAMYREDPGVIESTLIGEYFKGPLVRGIKGMPDYLSMKTYRICRADKETTSILYGEVYNPVIFLIASEYDYRRKVKKTRADKKNKPVILTNEVGENLYWFNCHVMSIDDASLTCRFYKKTKKEALSLRTRMYRYFVERESGAINWEEFKAYALALDPNVDWDMN